MLSVLFVTLGAMAQERTPHEGKRHAKDLSPEQLATLHTKKMTLHLDLTDAQQKHVQALHLEKAKNRKQKMEERQKSGDTEERNNLSPDERYARKSQRLDDQIAEKAKMRAILDDSQYQRWEKMVLYKHKRRKGEHHKSRSDR